MPTNKDFKRLVRTRMKKTGESYTAARAHLLPAKPSRKKAPAAAADLATIAGMSDAALKQKTGHGWKHWVNALDSVGADAWPHRRIAKHLHEEHTVPAWWCQMVTVGYERIKGLRAIGQRSDGTFGASKSKTFPVPLPRLYRAWSDARLRAKWLPGVALTVRTTIREKSMRITWPDRTSVGVWFVRKAAAKSQVAVEHGKLLDKSTATKMKAYWEERLRALGEVLGLPAK